MSKDKLIGCKDLAIGQDYIAKVYISNGYQSACSINVNGNSNLGLSGKNKGAAFVEGAFFSQFSWEINPSSLEQILSLQNRTVGTKAVIRISKQNSKTYFFINNTLLGVAIGHDSEIKVGLRPKRANIKLIDVKLIGKTRSVKKNVQNNKQSNIDHVEKLKISSEKIENSFDFSNVDLNTDIALTENVKFRSKNDDTLSDELFNIYNVNYLGVDRYK